MQAEASAALQREVIAAMAQAALVGRLLAEQQIRQEVLEQMVLAVGQAAMAGAEPMAVQVEQAVEFPVAVLLLDKEIPALFPAAVEAARCLTKTSTTLQKAGPQAAVVVAGLIQQLHSHLQPAPARVRF